MNLPLLELLRLVAAANDVTPDSLTISFKINRIFETLVDNLDKAGVGIEGIFAIDLARYVFSIGLWLYIGYEMWPCILGKKAPDVTKLLRPALLTMVISCWAFFYLEFNWVKETLTVSGRTTYITQQNEILNAERLIEERINRIDSIHKRALAKCLAEEYGLAQYENVAASDDLDMEAMADEWLQKKMEENKVTRVQAVIIGAENFVFTIVEDVIKWLGQIYLYLFFCGIIVIGELACIILGMFGPIAFGMSMFRNFRNMWANWIKSYLTFALYPFLGYIAMAYVSWVVRYFLDKQAGLVGVGDEQEWEKVISFTYGHFGILINYVIALFTGGYVLKAVPGMARMVFEGPSSGTRFAEGAGQFLGGMGMKVIFGTVKMVSKTLLGIGGLAAGGAGMLVKMKEVKGAASKASAAKKATQHFSSTKKNKMDSYAGYKPHKLSLGKEKTDVTESGFDYKRGEKTTTRTTGGYNPLNNNKHVTRGRRYELDTWANKHLKLSKLRDYKNNTLNFITSWLLVDENAFNEQGWAEGAKQLKGARRNISNIPWTLKYHFNKHNTNGTFQAVLKWQKETTSDIVFVRRPGPMGGFIYQTYGEDAEKMARLTGAEVKYMKVGNNNVAYFSLNKYTVQPVVHKLSELGLSVNIINSKGKSVYYKEDVTWNKQETIKRIKKAIGRKQGVMFKKTIKDAHVESTFNVFDNNKPKTIKSGEQPSAKENLTVKELAYDAFGALHALVANDKGNSRHIYLDRLTEEDLERIADILENKKNGDNEYTSLPSAQEDETTDGRSYDFIEKSNNEDEIDNVFDEGGFLDNERKDYQHLAEENKKDEEQKNKKDSPRFIKVFNGIVSKDMRQGVERKWSVKAEEKPISTMRMRGLPWTLNVTEEKESVIRRGRGIYFHSEDLKKHQEWTRLEKTMGISSKMTKLSLNLALATGGHLLNVAKGRRPLIPVRTIAKWGVNKTYNMGRWAARKMTERDAILAWMRENKHNIAIVKDKGTLQTYGEDAVSVARMLKIENRVKVVRIGTGESFKSGHFLRKNKVAKLTLTKQELIRLNEILKKRKLTMDVINKKNKSVLAELGDLSKAQDGKGGEGTPPPPLW